MDDISIFPDKETKPGDKDLATALGPTFSVWTQIQDFVLEKYPKGLAEWNYPGKKYGWNYRIKDKKRAIVYLLPRDGYFKVAFVFGQKATDEILASGISTAIKDEMMQAKKYAEGRGIRIKIADDGKISDILNLIEIKLAN
jgi:uncharacterized protein DUF3788